MAECLGFENWEHYIEHCSGAAGIEPLRADLLERLEENGRP